MTRREVFDKVKAHLLAQGEKALLGSECRYRAQGGLKCAVGLLIQDQYYSESLEGQNVSTSKVLDALRASGVDVDDMTTHALLIALQEVHDHHLACDWLDRLDAIEGRYEVAA